MSRESLRFGACKKATCSLQQRVRDTRGGDRLVVPALQRRELGARSDPGIVIAARRELPTGEHPAQGSTRSDQLAFQAALLQGLLAQLALHLGIMRSSACTVIRDPVARSAEGNVELVDGDQADAKIQALIAAPDP